MRTPSEKAVTKALVIDEPWITHILTGAKTWEMRSTETAHRGWFALIRKGSGTIVGLSCLESVGSPLDPDQLVATFEKHRIPEDMIRSGAVAKWNTPWKLADTIRFLKTVPYKHPYGAVTWVNLEAETSRAIASELQALGRLVRDRTTGGSLPTPAMPESAPPRDERRQSASTAMAKSSLIGETVLTEGNLKNNHFYLRGFIDRFPGDLVGGSNKASAAPRTALVQWGGNSPVETDIDGDKQFFRKRAWIGRFFANTGAKAGDAVVIEKAGPYRYSVKLVKAVARN